MDKKREDKKRLGVRIGWGDKERELEAREKQRDYRVFVFVCEYVSECASYTAFTLVPVPAHG